MKNLVLYLVSVIGFVSCKNTYIATVPQQIRPGEDAEIYIAALRPVQEQVRIGVTLMDKDNKTIQLTGPFELINQDPITVKLKIPVTINDDESYKIRVMGSGGLTFDETARSIRVSKKSSSIFIQTDKAAYKPGDLVQYRVVGTNSKLNVLRDPQDIIILDPKNNRVQQHLKVKPMFGVYTDSFQLSTLTNLGDWKIEVEQGREKTSKIFTVERFVLPRFEVDIIMPSFQLKTNKYVTVKVSAKYTFGKPVKGECELKLETRRSSKNAIIKNFPINGIATMRVLMTDLLQLDRFVYSFQVFAKVTEGITGISANDTKNVQLHDTPEKMSFSSTMSSNFKPGIPCNIRLRVTNQDDSLLDLPLGTVNVTVTYISPRKISPNKSGALGSHVETSRFKGRRPLHSRSQEVFLWSREIQIPKSGVIRTTALLPVTAEEAVFKAIYRKLSAQKTIGRARSPSDNFIQVSIVNDVKPVPNQDLPLKIETTEKIVQEVYYKVISKGSLVDKGRFVLKKGNGNASLKITYDMTPKAKLLVYYTRKNGEIVADAITFSIDDIFKTTVGIRFNKQKALPNENIALDIRARSESLVYVLAVDKSVLLYKSGNDISAQDVMKDLQEYDNSGVSQYFRSWDFWIPRPIGGVDAHSIFRQFGVIVLTDATLYQYPRLVLRDVMFIDERRPSQRRKMEVHYGSLGGGGGQDDTGGLSGGAGTSSLAKPTRIRKNFPETWLWANVTTGTTGSAVINTKAPDTITEWIASAFVVNPQTGFGVASEFANLTTFQRFFMRLDLPFSAIRGEQIIVQISVFNFLDTRQKVVVSLSNSKDFIFLNNNGNEITPGSGELSKTIHVKSNGVGAVYIPIQATVVGQIKLKATARSKIAADAVERDFLIEAEGIKQSYNVPLLIDLRSQNSFKSTIDIDFPPNLVQDSEFIKLQVIGDLLGSTLNGIDDLLRMSYGCGEQNLVGFSTNVYVTTYLKATGRLTNALKEKSEKILATGYQRELSYAHNDGSYSAFGNNDRSGTTWLTAYVIKSFSQASEYTFIDINVMTKAIKWIIRQQQQSGAYDEPGKVLHKEMQGGSASSQRSLACFVLIALEEAKRNNQVDPKIKELVASSITSATTFIAGGAPATTDNLYELAIMFYAMSLVNHNVKDQLLFELEKKAHISGGEKYWKLTDTVANKVRPWKSWSPPRTNARAVDVEMTSYVLLGYNTIVDTVNGIRVLRWLGNQRNPNGGFISTQDTVIALQALSGLGVKIFVKTFTMSVGTQSDKWTGRKFTVDDDNALILQNEDLPKTVKSISIDASGRGLCLFEAAVYYNVYEELREPAFDLTPTVLKETINGFTLRACIRWLRGGKSTMGLLEINIPSGMEADTDSLDTSGAQGQFTSVEKAFRQVNLFFDAILSTQMCIEIKIIRTSMVAKHKPQPIRLSEYYEPSNEVIKTYISTKLADATIIEVCGPENCKEVKKR